MKIGKSTFVKSPRRVRVAGVMISAVLALLVVGPLRGRGRRQAGVQRRTENRRVAGFGKRPVGRADGQRFGCAGQSWDQWRAMGRDKEGSIIADPKFVDPDNYDFRFASDAVIQQTGFEPCDYTQAGVYVDAAWIAQAKATHNSVEKYDHDEPR